MTKRELLTQVETLKNIDKLAGSCLKDLMRDYEAKWLKLYSGKTTFLEVYEKIESIAKMTPFRITEDEIKGLHELLYGNDMSDSGYRSNSVKIDDTGHIPPEADELDHFMTHFMSQMQISQKMFHPVEFATICYKRLLDLYPFKVGNEVVATLLLNIALINAGYEQVFVVLSCQEGYIDALKMAQNRSFPEVDPLICLVAKALINELNAATTTLES